MSKTRLLSFSAGPGSADCGVLSGSAFPLETVQSTPFLGLTLDCNLKWKIHLKDLLSRLSKASFAVGVISKVTDRRTSLVVYHAYFLSLLRYGIIFWGCVARFDSVLVLQKRTIRHVFQLSYRASCRPVFKENGLLTAPAIYIYELALFVFRNMDLFEEGRIGHPYGTRFSGLALPRHRLTLFESGPFYMGMKVFNALPEGIRSGTSLRAFKSELRKLLIELCPYKVQEFFTTMEH